MRLRGRNKSQRQSAEDSVKEAIQDSGESCLESMKDCGTLANKSREAVGKLLRRATKHGSSGTKKHDSSIHKRDSAGKPECRAETDNKPVGQEIKGDIVGAEGCSKDMEGNTSKKENVDGRNYPCTVSGSVEDLDESDWEDGSIRISDATNSHPMTIEFSETQQTVEPAGRKPIRRASAADKELAELVHKVHLLCLLARGRLIDSACDDPLIQAALLSLLPTEFLKISQVEKLTASSLHPLVRWFHNNFHVRSQTSGDRSFPSALARTLETREGTPEEIAALSVALLRALNLTTRFVSILNVGSIKPDAENSKSSSEDASRSSRGIFNNSTLMVAKPKQICTTPVKSLSCDKKDVCQSSLRCSSQSNEKKSKDKKAQSKDVIIDELNHMSSSLHCHIKPDTSEAGLPDKPQGSKRKGDLEFEMQLEIALSATATETRERGSNVDGQDSTSPKFSTPKRIKRILSEEPSHGISTAVGSSKVGSPLYWAEVYCSAENFTGKWVHVDAVNLIIDEEHKVEAAAAACKTSLRYVLAFAGQGVKDVTRRYCMKWYRIESHRVDTIWWNAVLAPLRILEEQATRGMVHLQMNCIDGSTEREKTKASESSSTPNQKDLDRLSSATNASAATRNDLEDMELETRALTEPLPTNQQAYKNHLLYAIEKWLTKYQILHPKGPILGFCSGHPVYPRTCVQTLKTKERWLREGLQIKANELPAKELKRPMKNNKEGQDSEADDNGQGDSREIIRLYGKWQLEPFLLPRAVNGIVPKNERGQVEVWSEKCLPPGTVHLGLPKVFYVAKRLEIDYAPAMVGFEFRNGQSYPVFDGIVVCTEFKDVILEAYAEEEERRKTEEKRKNEAQAISRWYQLLHSILMRQRLNSRYGESSSSQTAANIQDVISKETAQISNSQDDKQSFGCQQGDAVDTTLDTPSCIVQEDHEHVFLKENQSFDEETLVLTKRCRCGFSVQVEEL